jgi:aryl-phospho-beta-D-glucosidase BglC (GH1 family)
MKREIHRAALLLIGALVLNLNGWGCAESPDNTIKGVVPDPEINVNGTPLEINGQLHVADGFLMNQWDQPIQLRGMSTHGLQWHANCLKDSSLDLLADTWGADFLRLSVYVQEGGYEDDPGRMRGFVDENVDRLLERGMYALLDWHQLSPGDPNYNTELAKEYFTHMASNHGAKGNVIYEICNEPNGVGWSKIEEYAMEVIPVIRDIDPESVIVVGTPDWCLSPDAVIDNELPFENIMYTSHFYAASHGADSRRSVQRAADAGLAIFVTEFGTQTYSGGGTNDFGASQTWLDLLADNKISWSNWNFSDDPLSGAAWTIGTCKGQNWSDERLKEAGLWIKDKLKYPLDDFPQ